MNLQASAHDFLASTSLVSWEKHHLAHTKAVLQHASTGRMDAPALRAALGAAARSSPAVTTPASVALLELRGVLTAGDSFFTWLGVGTSVRAFMRELAAAAADQTVKQIVIVTDSPGGEIGMIPEANDLLRRTQAVKPVTVAVAGLNCSAAYWLTCAAGRIESTVSGRLGSIGVYSLRADLTDMLDREGVTIEVFSAGKFKAEGLEFTPITDAERKARQAEIDQAYGAFVDAVAAGRGVTAAAVRDGMGEGRTVTATDAKRLHMIDAVALVEDTTARAAAAPARMSEMRALQVELVGLAFASPPPATTRQREALRLQASLLQLSF